MAIGEHLTFLFTHDQVVMVLHRDELGPAVFLGQRIHFGDLVGVCVGDADVSHFAGPDRIVHALQNFFGGSLVVPDVIDVQVHMIHAQVLQTGVDGVHHVLLAIDASGNFFFGSWQEFGGNHHVLATGHVT